MTPPRPSPPRFGGFCPDTFRFLRELAANKPRVDGRQNGPTLPLRRARPLVELCRALAERYVEPVLRRRHGWDLDTAARSGRALTSVCKNDYGRSVPYNTTLWMTFCRRRSDAQFFVRSTPRA